MDRHRLYRLSQQMLLIGLRAVITLVKFGLTIYTARYLGLADLGVYGLVVGASTIIPAFFGFGVTDFVCRKVAHLRLAEAMPFMTTRIALTATVHLVLQPLAFVVNAALGAPVPWSLLIPISLVLVLDHLVLDTTDLLTYRGRVQLANFLFFVRAGSWPLVVIAWGLLDPAARTLDHIFLGWLGALLAALAIIGLLLLRRARWRLMGLRPGWLMQTIRKSAPFYVKDIAGAAGLFLDRFLISLFLGLELTGVYTLFWSVANVANTLIAAVFQTNAAPLIQAGRNVDLFEARKRRMHAETAIWSAGIGIGAVVAMPLLLPFLGRPLLEQNLPVFWVLIVATLFRIAADSYSIILLALHRDQAIAAISIIGALASAILNLALLPVLGLYGAAIAYGVVGLLLLGARLTVSRRGLSPLAAS